ncbi:MAG: GatB/YqeY domain-containing protein [Bacilli bacterium]|nr:GatB/YqeY domain-containing protein [Bacilli bacterium]
MYNKIIEDMTKAMKEKEKNRLTVIRGIKAAVDKEHIDKKLEITDELVIDVISHQVKLLKDSILEFEKGKREDLIEKAEKEMSILKEYLPTELSKEEVIKIIEDSFSKINPTSMKEMGKVMKEITPLVKGRYDMSKISEMIKEKLS